VGIKFGEIDSTQIVENEYRISILEHVINIMMQRNPAMAPTNQEMQQIQQAVIRHLQQKYPNSGIGIKNAEAEQR
jgi:hypothetical protein